MIRTLEGGQISLNGGSSGGGGNDTENKLKCQLISFRSEKKYVLKEN